MTTVYFLGAGSSIGASSTCPTAFPRTRDILRTVRTEVCQAENHPLHALTCYLRRYSPLSRASENPYYLSEEWDAINIEELFAAADFESRLTSHLATQKWWLSYFGDSYREHVTSIMDGPWKAFPRTGPWDSQLFPYLHADFLRVVRFELAEAVSWAFDKISSRTDPTALAQLASLFRQGDTVVTTNYDLLLERVLRDGRPQDWSFQTGYALRPANEEDSPRFTFSGEANAGPSVFKFLKLHGSCNWHFLTQVGQKERVLERIGAGFDAPAWECKEFIVTDNYRPMGPNEAMKNHFVERFMIPPTPFKPEYQFDAEFATLPPDGERLPIRSRRIWIPQMLFTAALSALRSAERIVFVGYSMPAADSSIRMLLCTAAEASSSLKKVVSVNPDSKVAETIQRLYRRLPLQTFPDLGAFAAGAGSQ